VRLHLAPALALGMLSLLGCQGKSPANPAVPASTPATPISYIPAATLLAGGDRASYEGTLGAWTLDIVGTQGSLTPARELAATPGIGSFDVDITDALTRTFCRDCVTLKSIELDGNDRPVITIGIRHPFELGDPGNPITAQNRRDLFLFNVKGILRTSENSELVNGVTYPDDVLISPDGYYFNQGLFDGGIPTQEAFPYMVFGVDEFLTGTGNFNATTGQWDAMDAPTGFNVLGQGQSATAAYTFDVGSGDSFSVDLVLVGQYGQSVENKAQRMSPEYYAAEFSAGPWRVTMDDFAAPFSTVPGSPLATTVRVWDFAMGHGNHDIAYPSADYLGTSWFSDITVELFIPAFRATPFVPGDPANGTGAIGDPLIFSVTADNQLSAPNGDYPGLLKVTSNRPVGTANPGEADDVSGIAADLDATNLIPLSEIATYLPVDVTVSAVIGLPPVADLDSSKATMMVGNGAYFFPGPGTTDPDGTITQYVYDGDWDGVPANFSPDYIMPTPSPVAIRFPAVGTTTVGLRVRDNDNNYGYDSLVMNVTPVGDPFPASNPESVLPGDIDPYSTLNHKQLVAIDRNFPGNVYVIRDSNMTATTEATIHRSKDFGRTFDSGTAIQTIIRSHTGDTGCAFGTSIGLSVLADGSLGLVWYNTSTSASATCVDGRGIYYVWIDADPAGIGVNPGAGAHDNLRVTPVTAGFPTITQVGIEGHPTDATKAQITGVIRPGTGLPNTVVYCVVNQANSANPVPLVYDELVPAGDQSNIGNMNSYMDPATGDMHITWEESWPNGGPVTDWFLSYMRVSNNNPVYGGAITRVSRDAVGGVAPNANFQYPRVTTIGGNQAVISFIFSDAAASVRDVCLLKVADSGSAHSYVLPMTRISLPNGQAYVCVNGDPLTNRISAIWQGGTGTSGTATAEPLNVSYSYFDSNLNSLFGPGVFSTSVTSPIAPQRNHDTITAIDPATGEIFGMYDQLNGTEQSPYRISN